MVVGSASRDLDPTDPRGWRLGGGVTYSAMALARLGLRVAALMGVDEQAAQAHELDLLRGAGVDVRLVQLPTAPVFDNRETADGRRQVAHAVSAPLRVAALPDRWRGTACLLLNPVAGELGDEWAAAMPGDALVALGWQGLLRRLVAGAPVEPLPVRPSPLIERADIATVSVEDAAGGADLPLVQLLPRAGQQLVVTSDRGVSLHGQRLDGRFRWRTVPVRPVRVVRDPTGAGDVFLATWLAGVIAARAAGREPDAWPPLALAAAAAGAKVELGGLAEIADLRELCRRLMPQGDPPAA